MTGNFAVLATPAGLKTLSVRQSSAALQQTRQRECACGRRRRGEGDGGDALGARDGAEDRKARHEVEDILRDVVEKAREDTIGKVELRTRLAVPGRVDGPKVLGRRDGRGEAQVAHRRLGKWDALVRLDAEDRGTEPGALRRRDRGTGSRCSCTRVTKETSAVRAAHTTTMACEDEGRRERREESAQEREERKGDDRWGNAAEDARENEATAA